MAEPIDAIQAIHNAFRNDLERIDAAALDSARGKEGLPSPSNVSDSSTKYWSGMPTEKS